MIEPAEYTARVRAWLDDRFRAVDQEGVYIAHQPIYGFRRGHSEERLIERYVITYQIMRALSRLRFRTLLDVGGAEGYKAALARHLFGVEVRSSDLSGEACRRAREIFGIPGEAVDVHRLPYADGEFDVVLASETLEHVPDLERAARELVRVARRAVVITVPREPPAIVAENIRSGQLGAHIHALHRHSFDAIVPPGARLEMVPLLSPLLKIPFALAEATSRSHVTRYPRALLAVYNALVPVLGKVFGRRAALRLIQLDEQLAPRGDGYSGMLFLLVKDSECLLPAPGVEVTREQVLGFSVPLHRPAAPSASDPAAS